MSFEPHDYLRHILVEADYLIRESADVSGERFMADETLQRAFVEVWKSSAKPPRKSRTPSGHDIQPSSGGPWRPCATV